MRFGRGKTHPLLALSGIVDFVALQMPFSLGPEFLHLMFRQYVPGSGDRTFCGTSEPIACNPTGGLPRLADASSWQRTTEAHPAILTTAHDLRLLSAPSAASAALAAAYPTTASTVSGVTVIQTRREAD